MSVRKPIGRKVRKTAASSRAKERRGMLCQIERMRNYTALMANGDVSTERRMSAWVGKALLIQGKIISTENLTIDGRVEGTIELGDHSLTIGAGASVAADLVAQTIVISGEVTGNVNATVKVDLHASAAVHGDVSTPLIAMADGAVVTGRLDVAG